jgi:hypothetical protein
MIYRDAFGKVHGRHGSQEAEKLGFWPKVSKQSAMRLSGRFFWSRYNLDKSG